MAAGTVADARYRQVAVITGDATKAAIDATRLLSRWGFDGPLGKKIQGRLYKAAIMEHVDIKELERITDFRRTIMRGAVPVLVEFYSPTCPTCRMMDSRVAAVAQQFKDLIKILKVNKEKFQMLIDQQQPELNMLPAFIMFKNGKELSRHEGEATKEQLCKFVTDACAKAPRTGPQPVLDTKREF